MVIRLPLYGRSDYELPTVAQALEFPTIMRGDPVVVSGAAGLDRRVRWVHMSEAVNVDGLLHGGELLLCMGIVFPEAPAGLTKYVERLIETNAAALVIGLGPRYKDRLPTALVEACEKHGLPLIALRRKIAFIDVTEEVHASLIDIKVRDLQATESIHRIFGALAVHGSKAEIVLAQVAKLSGFAVVLGNQSRQILAFDPAERTAEDVIAEWSEHSHRPHKAARTFYDPLSGWLQTTVGARGNNWGRLVLIAPLAGARDLDAALDPTMTVHHSLVRLVEQAAWTLAICRLVDRESQLLDLTTHSNVFSKLLAGGHDEELDQQSEALGVSFRRTRLAGLAFCSRGAAERTPGARQRGLRALAEAISDIARDARVSSLVAPVDDFTVGMLTTIPHGSTDLDLAGAIAQQLGAAGITVIASSGGYGQGVEAARTVLLEAIETVSTALSMSVESNVVTAADLGVRGLLHTLRDDPRVIHFSERTIGPLVAYDAANHTTLVSLLRHFLDAGRNKTVAAKRAFVSRPWMHERLRLIGDVLGVELENESDCENVQVALLVMDAQRARETTHRKTAP